MTATARGRKIEVRQVASKISPLAERFAGFLHSRPMKQSKPPIERSCKDCRHFNETATWDECRRYPPVAIMDEGDVVFVFPAIKPDEWCGEWSPNLND
ncbi:hypothetical protein CAL19_12735 [Bordetella genomosp. 7]|uniref:Uncharacterized protein n=1 Tax=Bordetella genomosp. 7 TaxID=1416805 RepID=A0A261QZ00_9BORD|nr:hypothetical protein CAL19_12735 [Bordetella genomosp. 7]